MTRTEFANANSCGEAKTSLSATALSISVPTPCQLVPPKVATRTSQSVTSTGLRQANVTRLQWKQVSLERRHLWVSGAEHKNGRPHSVPLNQAAMDVLLKRQGEHPTHVFTYEGSPIVQVNTKAWRNSLQRAGILDFRWHDLRHTFATWHREAGTPTHELQRLGGWKTQSMAERYAHVAAEGLQFTASRIDTLMQGCVAL